MRLANLVRTLAFGAAMSFSWGSQALDIPRGSAADARVKRVAYNEHDVVALYSYSGAATQIVFAPGERVLDIASGFSAGWQVSDRRNVIYVKPQSVVVDGVDGDETLEPQPGEWDTNLIVETDVRTYLFQLFLIGSTTGKGGLEYDPRAAYRIQFTYPRDEALAASSADAKAESSRRLGQSNAPRNLNYTMRAARRSDSITPAATYDDGRFTYLTFPAGRELPTVFLVDEDGGESIVNTHVSGDTLVVHRVAPRLVLRLGRKAISVFNESFDPAASGSNNGTTVPGVARVLAAGERDDAPAAAPLAGLADTFPMPTDSVLAAAAAADARTTVPVPAASTSPAKPAYTALPNAPVQATLRTWLPVGWTLAWDTAADPRGVAVESSGDFLDAVRSLFATRGQWGAQLEARVYPDERILQVRDAPAAPASATVMTEQL